MLPTTRRLALALGSTLIAIALLAPPRGVPAAGDSPLHLPRVSGGALPFTESWGQIVARDQRSPWTAPSPGLAIGPRDAARATAAGPALPATTAAVQLFPPPGPEPRLAVGASFPGLDRLQVLADPVRLEEVVVPDTMGAIGPAHFVECVNEGFSIYTRTGVPLGTVRLRSFFSVQRGGVTYPRPDVIDPRVLFDRRSRRWFAVVQEFGIPAYHANNMMLAVSRTADPTGLWDKYVLPVALPDQAGHGFYNDFPTLGLDDNGLYLGLAVYDSDARRIDPALFFRIVATGKRSLLRPSPFLGPVFDFQFSDLFTPTHALNLDPAGPGDPAWFVGGDPAGDTRQPTADLRFRRLTWRRGVPSLGATLILPVPPHGAPLNAPARDSQRPICTNDDRTGGGAVLRRGRLWSTRTVGVNASGEVTLSAGGSDADRTAAEWFSVDLSSGAPVLAQMGRVYDPAATDPRFYFFPSIMVNGQGHATLGCSGSRATEFVGAYTCSRLAGDPPGTMGAVTLLRGGLGAYNREPNASCERWGDYSATSLDPNDDMSFWTIQEYAGPPTSSLASDRNGVWAAWIAQVAAPAPVLASVSPASARAGAPSVRLVLQGSGFYDPGPTIPNHLTVKFGGGDESDFRSVRVVSVTPTRVVVTFSLAHRADPGPRDVVVINPDGQAAALPGGFSVRARGR